MSLEPGAEFTMPTTKLDQFINKTRTFAQSYKQMQAMKEQLQDQKTWIKGVANLYGIAGINFKNDATRVNIVNQNFITYDIDGLRGWLGESYAAIVQETLRVTVDVVPQGHKSGAKVAAAILKTLIKQGIPPKQISYEVQPTVNEDRLLNAISKSTKAIPANMGQVRTQQAITVESTAKRA